ncbi:unnamed protein product [Lactuca saligna]|uniref:Uncharacterized protein n=1 Tax=Lactuca saligna TaxID=75948 RepID=A0AA35YDM7_LACSI|nr:unnamed protein product [Lactuca saligna]
MEKLDDLEETSDLGFESSTISSLDQGADNSFAYYTTYLRLELQTKYTQEEVEYDLQLVIDKVKEKLRDIKSPEVSLWSTPFYDIKWIKKIQSEKGLPVDGFLSLKQVLIQELTYLATALAFSSLKQM